MRKLQDLLCDVEIIAKGAPFGNRNAAKNKDLVQDATKNKGSVQDPANNRLSPEQIASIKKEMVSSKEATPVRFVKEGHNINITSGEAVKGSNIINQVHYWNFTKETSKKIADMIGAKPIFSEEEKADPWKEQRKAEKEYEVAEENHNKVGSKETLAQLHSAKEKLMESSRAIDELKKGAPLGNRNAAKDHKKIEVVINKVPSYNSVKRAVHSMPTQLSDKELISGLATIHAYQSATAKNILPDEYHKQKGFNEAWLHTNSALAIEDYNKEIKNRNLTNFDIEVNLTNKLQKLDEIIEIIKGAPFGNRNAAKDYKGKEEHKVTSGHVVNVNEDNANSLKTKIEAYKGLRGNGNPMIALYRPEDKVMDVFWEEPDGSLGHPVPDYMIEQAIKGETILTGYQKTDKYINDVARTLDSLRSRDGKLFEHDSGMDMAIKHLKTILPDNNREEMLRIIDKEYTQTIKQANAEKNSSLQRYLMGMAVIYEKTYSLLDTDSKS